MRLLATVLVSSMVLTTGCASMSAFPPSPKQHRYYTKLVSPPDAYYKGLVQGLYDRLTKTAKVNTSWQQLLSMSRGWSIVDKLDRVDDVQAFMRAHKLRFLVKQVREVRESQRAQRPATVNDALEAGAVKQAMVHAYYRLKDKLAI